MESNAKSSPWNCSDDERNQEMGQFDTPVGSGSSSVLDPIRDSLSTSSSNMDSIESSQDDSIVKKELSKEEAVGTSHAVEPLLALNLGMEKKYKSNGTENTQYSCCQVEGCGLDLSSFKYYYRKNRVCENHSKSPKVIISGLERRFCQQCSRFHSLEEFDGIKRSCRSRLSHHNAMRRKSYRQADQSNQPALSSSHSDGSQQTSPFASPSTSMNLAWQNIPDTKANSEIPRIVPMITDYPNLHFASKVFPTNNIEDSIITSSDPIARLDFHPALLRSTTSSDSYETNSISVEHSNHTTSTSQPITNAMSQHMPPASSEYLPTDHDQQANSDSWSAFFENFKRPEEPDESRFRRLD